jgi:hypothetical protein
MQWLATLVVALAMAGLSAGCTDRAVSTITAAPDGSSQDIAPPLPDTAPPSPDSVPHAACSPLAAMYQKISGQMVICRAVTSARYDQCQASTLCGPGWRLCKASEYRSRFSASASPPNTETTWIAGCVMTAGKPHAPVDRICGDCTVTVTKAPFVGWHCYKDVVGTVQRPNAGLASHPECWRAGVKAMSAAAYWTPITPDYKLRQAFCCK